MKTKTVKLSDLPKEIQLQLRATPYEIENSQRTHKQNYVVIHRDITLKGVSYRAEIILGNCDIRQSEHHIFDDIINYWADDDTGREVDPRVYSRDKASDMYCTADLDECYVTLTPLANQGAGL